MNSVLYLYLTCVLLMDVKAKITSLNCQSDNQHKYEDSVNIPELCSGNPSLEINGLKMDDQLEVFLSYAGPYLGNNKNNLVEAFETLQFTIDVEDGTKTGTITYESGSSITLKACGVAYLIFKVTSTTYGMSDYTYQPIDIRCIEDFYSLKINASAETIFIEKNENKISLPDLTIKIVNTGDTATTPRTPLSSPIVGAYIKDSNAYYPLIGLETALLDDNGFGKSFQPGESVAIKLNKMTLYDIELYSMPKTNSYNVSGQNIPTFTITFHDPLKLNGNIQNFARSIMIQGPSPEFPFENDCAMVPSEDGFFIISGKTVTKYEENFNGFLTYDRWSREAKKVTKEAILTFALQERLQKLEKCPSEVPEQQTRFNILFSLIKMFSNVAVEHLNELYDLEEQVEENLITSAIAAVSIMEEIVDQFNKSDITNFKFIGMVYELLKMMDKTEEYFGKEKDRNDDKYYTGVKSQCNLKKDNLMNIIMNSFLQNNRQSELPIPRTIQLKVMELISTIKKIEWPQFHLVKNAFLKEEKNLENYYMDVMEILLTGKESTKTEMRKLADTFYQEYLEEVEIAAAALHAPPSNIRLVLRMMKIIFLDQSDLIVDMFRQLKYLKPMQYQSLHLGRQPSSDAICQKNIAMHLATMSKNEKDEDPIYFRLDEEVLKMKDYHEDYFYENINGDIYSLSRMTNKFYFWHKKATCSCGMKIRPSHQEDDDDSYDTDTDDSYDSYDGIQNTDSYNENTNNDINSNAIVFAED